MFQWDDLKPFLAVARHGSTIAAARALGVDQSTVQRRIAALERCIGQPLVERHPSGYRLTAYGEELRPLAEAVEQQVQRLQQRVRDTARELNGVVRLTCPEPIVQRIARSAFLARLQAAHPRLRVEFVISDRYVDLAKGGADVALRSGDTVDLQLVGRKVADSLWAAYASREYVARHGAPASLTEASRHPWAGLDASLGPHRLTQWLQQAVPAASIVATSSSVLGLVQSVKAAVAIGALPTALGDSDADLVRLFGPIPELARSWRILTTPALRRTPRVDAFFRFVASEGATLRPILTG